MIRKTKETQVRCDSCFNFFDPDVLVKFRTDMICEGCEQYHLRRTGVIPLTPTGKQVKQAIPPRHKGKKWFAIQIFGSDAKAKQSITKRLKLKQLTKFVGKIIIPKQKTIRTTRANYEVISTDNTVIGYISADSAEDALFQARNKFGNRKGGRGVFHPVQYDDHYDHIEKGQFKNKLGRLRTGYATYSNTGRLMGIIYARAEKQARGIAERLYAPKETKTTNPRETITKWANVKEVRLIKEGGERVIKNQKIMAGYLIALITEDPIVFDVIKSAYGVITILPYGDKPTPEELSEMKAEGVAPPHPTAIPEKEIETFVEKPKPYVPNVKYKIGDKIKIVGGIFAGVETCIKAVIGTVELPRLRVDVPLVGRWVETVVEDVDVRSN